MLRKLLAAVFAATLMAGSAWGATATDYYHGTAPTTTAPTGSWTAWVEGTTVLPATAAGAGDVGYGIVSSTGTPLTSAGAAFIGNAGAGALFIGAASDGTLVTPASRPFTFTINGALTVNSTQIDNKSVWVGAGNTLKITGLLTVTAAGTTAGTHLGIVADGAGSVIESGTLAFSSTTGFITARNGGLYRNLDTAAGGTTIDATANTDGLQLIGGKMSFAGLLNMDKGTIYSIAGTDSSVNDLAVGGAGLKYIATTGNPTDALIDVADGTTLNIKKTLDGTELADVTMSGGTIKMAATAATPSTLNVGTLNITPAADADVGFTATRYGTINAEKLNITAAAGVEFTDSATVATVVSGLSTLTTGTYHVAGTNNQYNGGLDIKTGGVLDGLTPTNTTITTGENYVTLYSNAKIMTAVDTTFLINGAGVKVTENTTTNKATIDASGDADAKIAIEKDLIVDGNLDLVGHTTGAVAGTSAITVGRDFIQNSGTVTESANTTFTVTGQASIGEGEGTAEFIVTSDGTAAAAATTGTTTFKNGVTIGENGTLKGSAAGKAIKVGDNKTVELAGGLLQDLALSPETAGANVNLTVTKENSHIINVAALNTQKNIAATDYDFDPTEWVGGNGNQFKSVTITAGDLAFYTGAVLQTANNFDIKKDAILTISNQAGPLALGGAGTVKGTPANNGVFTADANSNIDLENNSLVIDDFKNINLNGNVYLGTGNTITVNNSGGIATQTTTIGNTAKIIFTPQYAAGIKAGDEVTGAKVINVTTPDTLNPLASEWQNNALGQFRFALDTDPARDFIYLAEANSVTQGSNDEADFLRMTDNLAATWSPSGAAGAIDASIVSNVYDFIYGDGPANADWQGTFTYDEEYSRNPGTPAANPNGVRNIFRELLHATAIGDTTRVSEGTFKTVFGNGDVSDMLNAGTGEVQGIQSAIGARNTQLRGQMAAAGDVYYEYANPTLLLNNDYANRIWAGYIGQWEKADTRDNVSGYDYDSHGFIIGYDRLVGCNFAFGGAFAYSRGDYEDKAADTNNSKIDNYSVNAYATYSALNGVFASLFGGYMYQDNDLSATYRTTARKADYDADFWNIGGQLGYDFQPVDGLILTPSIGLQYIHGSAESFTSSLTGPASATYGYGYVSGTSSRSLLLPIELAARYAIDFSDCSRLAIEGNLGYSYNFLDDGGDAGMIAAGVTNAAGAAVGFAGREREQSRHTFNAGAGLRYTFNRFDIGVKYDFYLRQDAHAHRVMGSLGLSF